MKVIKDFTDLKDNRRIYRVGDDYPHKDAPKPTKARKKQLSTDKNKRNEPLIKDEENLDDLTVKQLKEQLDEQNIEYNSKTKKDELIELLTNE
jgi:hypothetical protein